MSTGQKPEEEDDLTVTVEEVEGEAQEDASVAAAAQDDEGKKPPAKTADAAVITAEEGIEALKQQLDEAKRREAEAEAARQREATQRQEAERLAAERQAQVARATTSIEQAQYDAVLNAIDALNKEAEGATAEYERLMESGDYKGAALAQRKLAKAEAQITRLEDGKSALEARLQAQREQAQRPPQQQPAAPSDPVENYIRQFSPRSQSYIRKHVDHVTDPKLNRKMIRAHEDAVDEGYIPDTDAYFAALDEKLGFATPQTAEALTPQQPAQRRAPPVSAPVVRQPPSASGERRPTQVTLTRAEREAAEMAGVTPLEYAKQKLRLQASGELGTSH